MKHASDAGTICMVLKDGHKTGINTRRFLCKLIIKGYLPGYKNRKYFFAARHPDLLI